MREDELKKFEMEQRGGGFVCAADDSAALRARLR